MENQIKDGKEFVLINEKEANAFLQRYGYMASREDGIHFLDGSVPHTKPDVNQRFSIDLDYMDAVNRGDTEAVQKMVDEAAEAALADSAIRGKDDKLLPV